MTEPGAPAPLLEVRELSVFHGQLCALDGIDLAVAPGETYAIIGANGAGKSTLLRTIVGLHHPRSGRILVDGRDVTREPTDRRLAAGLALVPEGRRLFSSLTVEENLLVGMHKARPGRFDLDHVFDLFPWIPSRRKQRASQLSGGEQQAVALCRALLANPRVLLLDELSLGLAPIVVRRIYEVLPVLVAEGLTVLLVEQDVAQARQVATHVHCLLEGRTSLQGRPDELTAHQIEEAYFGVSTIGAPRSASTSASTSAPGSTSAPTSTPASPPARAPGG